jgi:hypothetical protein
VGRLRDEAYLDNNEAIIFEDGTPVRHSDSDIEFKRDSLGAVLSDS